MGTISFALMGCANSALSTDTVTDPALLQVNLIVSRRVNDDNDKVTNMEAYVKDKDGKAVANPDIRIKVNGTAMRLNGGSVNYYGAFPYYELSDSNVAIKADADYIFSMVMTNGKEYSIGKLRTQRDLTSACFLPPTKHQRSQELILRWKDVETRSYLANLWKRCLGEGSRSELKLFKISETKDKWDNVVPQSGSTNEADYLTTTLGTGDGTYVVPVSFLQGPLRTFNALGLMISSTETVKADEHFLPGSTITSSREDLYRIEMID